MKALYDVPAPAKLNLFLHITGRRDDGYHLLQSAFMLIDWHDTLHFEPRPGGALSREDLGPPLPEDDLCLRAARALQQATACTQGAHIAIDKRVPAQAGMGGGSSDAASCLLALNRLWRLNLDLTALEKIGLSLGADVPFFLRGRNAWVEGIGENITPIRLPPARFLVVKPDHGLDTKKIFSDPLLNRSTKAAILAGFAAHDTESSCGYGSEEREFTPGESGFAGWEFGHNDLQPVAQRLCPGVTQALEWLSQQGLSGRMTGSGSAVFAKWPEATTPSNTFGSLPGNWQARLCSNMAVHPLAGWATSDSSSVGG